MTPKDILIYRGRIIESRHRVIFSVKDIYNNNILSTNKQNQLIYPRSAIKIFQALPFIKSNAHKLFKLNKKNIAIACSSHSGENIHIHVLENWLKKIHININQLKCGIHNPLNEKISNNLLLSGQKPNQLHNNCSGKHLAMISGCLANKITYKNYNQFHHPYQSLIRESLEYFMKTKIKKNCIGKDGCNAPQYAFPLKNIAQSMINLIKEKEQKSIYANAINTVLESIKKYPFLIGGKSRFDSELIKITEGRIFCKGGAEGVLLFADFSKKIGGAIKVIDGNNRAIPSITMQIFSKLKLLSRKQIRDLDNWKNQILFNHDKKNIGKIEAKL